MNMEEPEKSLRSYSVDVSFSMPVEFQAAEVVSRLLPMEFKFNFAWDEAKRLRNIERRGVDFKDAALIFEGPVIAKEDTREDYGERRFRALGKVDDEYYIVAYTLRESICWIISAWKVGENGKRRYEEILSR
jgi:uncharacterized DUF497 family protein